MIKLVKNNKTIGLDFFKSTSAWNNVSLFCLLSPNKEQLYFLTILIHNIKDRELLTMQR